MDKREQPVGVFDSGVGGISVLREMVRLMPEENFYFFGDSIHAPYGTKRLEEIQRLTLENVAYMDKKGIKAIVVACNTATSAAITLLRQKYTRIPVVGIEPALKPAVMEKEKARILVLATPMTVQADKFQSLMHQYESRATVIPVGCPGLMEYVENGKLEGEEVEGYLRKLLSPYLMEELDAAVLGCTHYPFLKKAIRNVLGPEPHIIDGSAGTARELRRRLIQMDLKRDGSKEGRVIFEESIPEKIPLCRYLLSRQ